MLAGEHSAILSTFIKLPFVFKTFVWSIFEWRPGFALGFIFLSPPFSPIRFFLCHFLEFKARFLAICRQKRPGFGAFFAKSLLSLTPLILVDYSIHIDTITMELSICV